MALKIGLRVLAATAYALAVLFASRGPQGTNACMRCLLAGGVLTLMYTGI